MFDINGRINGNDKTDCITIPPDALGRQPATVVRTVHQPLFWVCRASNQALVRVGGGGFTLSGKDKWKSSLEAAHELPMSFHFLPFHDTVHLSSPKELFQLFDNGSITRNGFDKDTVRFGSVRSLILSGLWPALYYSHHRISDDSTTRTSIFLQEFGYAFYPICGKRLELLLSCFPNLEELIINFYPAVKIGQDWTKLCRSNFTNANQGWVLSEDVDCEIRVKEFPETLEKSLQLWRSKQESVPKSRRKCISGVQVEDYSDWWSKPKVTMMTAYEMRRPFGSRHRRGYELPGDGYMDLESGEWKIGSSKMVNGL